MKILAISLFLVATIVCRVSSYKILCAFPTVSKSHFIVVQSLLKGLAEKGHNVTVISSFPLDKPIENYRNIVKQTGDLTERKYLLDKFLENSGSFYFTYKNTPRMTYFEISQNENLINNLEVQQLLREESFDLVILESYFGESLLGLGAHFNCPIALFSSLKPTNYLLNLMANPIELSHVSNGVAGIDEPMSFKDRVKNMILYLLNIPMDMYAQQYHKRFHAKYFPSPKYPTHEELKKEVSVVFTVHHFSEGNIRPYYPNIIEVGGIQVKDHVQPLPYDLQKWMDNSQNGVIYFSLGTNFKSSVLPRETIDSILYVFSQLKENVLWKFENESIGGLPSNVRISQWVPQNDLLQHKNLKLFITHGGLGSVVESKFYGIPLIVIPIFADQMSNAKLVEREGWGVTFAFSDFTERKFAETIREVLNNKNYTYKAKHISTLYRDRPHTPMETAIYWVEYVIRHDGAKHMQSKGVYLNFIQYHSFDVIGFLTLIALVLILVLSKLVKIVLFVSNSIKISSKKKVQ